MFNVDSISEKLKHNVLIENIDTVPKGHIRISTGFLYPDGSSIDVYLQQPADGELPDIHNPRLTDFGNTWSWLQHIDLKPNKTALQKVWFTKTLELYGCELHGAALECELKNLEDLPYGVINLGQACMRTADLIYTKRFRAQNNFNMEVEEVISDINNNYETDAEIPLVTGNIIKVDFRVHGIKRDTAVQTLSTGASPAAHSRANEIFARWIDIIELSDWEKNGGQCVTIYNDSLDVYDTKDLNRLERKSLLLPISSTETLNDIFKAA